MTSFFDVTTIVSIASAVASFILFGIGFRKRIEKIEGAISLAL